MIHGAEISHKTDVWPLGLTMWEMLALMPPHSDIDDSMEDNVECVDDTVCSEGYFSERYGNFIFVY